MIKSNFIRQFATVLLGCLLSVQTSAQQYKTEFLFSGTAPENIRKTMQTNANVVFAEMHRAFFDKTKSGLTFSLSNVENNETIKRILTMWDVSHFRCTETSVITTVLKSSNSYQVRDIPIYFENDNFKEKYQDLVIEFTLDGKISDLYFALPQHQYAKIMENSIEDIDDLRKRQVIMQFVEYLRMAYLRKDIESIDSFFNEGDLILPGKAGQQIKSDTLMGVDSHVIKYNTFLKQQYINRLRHVFANDSYINVEFDDIVINRHGDNPNFYGVTLKLNWESSHYSDGGWLFLMLDFSDENNPVIWVRTWQPLKDGNGDDIHYNPEDIFGLGHFPVK